MSNILNRFEKAVVDIIQLKEIEEARLLESISEGKWSIRDIVAHLYYWDKFNLENMLPYMTDGANLPVFPDHDTHNAEGLALLRDHSIESIVDLFVKERRKLIEQLNMIDDDIRFTIGKGKRKFSVESFAKIFLEHDLHHLKQINLKLLA
ncbi:DinB family protein [Ornithinibacillus californiensis]|uniref:DinB family protein n=1 Tax=Ornithinibacillus californiensis TaxID=161536 RepID=UPI00064D82DC|nr:DinB family protein [Ornithinibacillus californiensis]